MNNRPFPSSSQPPFQSEAKCEDFVIKISFHLYVLKLELIIMTKISHLDSLWKRDWGEFGNGLLIGIYRTSWITKPSQYLFVTKDGLSFQIICAAASTGKRNVKSYIKHSKECFIRYPNTSKLVKKNSAVSFFQPISQCLDIWWNSLFFVLTILRIKQLDNGHITTIKIKEAGISSISPSPWWRVEAQSVSFSLITSKSQGYMKKCYMKCGVWFQTPHFI